MPMKKKLLITATILLFVAICAVSCSSVSSSNDVKEYSFDEKFTYEIPSDWDHDNIDDCEYYYMNGSGNGDGMVFASFSEVDGVVSDDEFFDDFIEGTKESDEYDGEMKTYVTEVDGSFARNMSYKLKGDGNTYYATSVIFSVNDGIGYVGITSINKDDYTEEFQKIIDSIKIDYSEKTEEVTEDNYDTDNRSNIEDCDITFFGDYQNDVTGNWKRATTSAIFDPQDYALSYYDTYFGSNDETHFIVNFTMNTTTRISNIGGVLDVSIYDYVDGEEHDADKACSGTLLNEYNVDIGTGEITKIQ